MLSLLCMQALLDLHADTTKKQPCRMEYDPNKVPYLLPRIALVGEIKFQFVRGFRPNPNPGCRPLDSDRRDVELAGVFAFVALVTVSFLPKSICCSKVLYFTTVCIYFAHIWSVVFYSSLHIHHQIVHTSHFPICSGPKPDGGVYLWGPKSLHSITFHSTGGLLMGTYNQGAYNVGLPDLQRSTWQLAFTCLGAL